MLHLNTTTPSLPFHLSKSVKLFFKRFSIFILVFFSALGGVHGQVTIVECIGTQVEPDPAGQNPMDYCLGTITLLLEDGLGPYELHAYSETYPQYNIFKTINTNGESVLYEVPNLCAGFYTFEITDKLECVHRIEDHEIKDCSLQPLEDFGVSFSITHSSAEPGNDGSIEMIFENPQSPGLIWTWSARDYGEDVISSNQLILENLPAGDYYLEISDNCKQERHQVNIRQCATDLDASDIDIVSTPSIAGQSNGRVEVRLPNHPIIREISWSNGHKDPVQENLAPGTYCFEGVANNRQCFSGCVTVDQADYAISHIEPSCEGLGNGAILFEYKKSSQELNFQIFVNDLEFTPSIPINTTSTSLIEFIVDNLEGDKYHKVDFIINGEIVTEYIYVPEISLTKEYTGLANDDSPQEIAANGGFRTCTFNLLCKGTVVFSGLKEQVEVLPASGESSTGDPIFGIGRKCNAVVGCGNQDFDAEGAPIIRMPIWLYRSVLDGFVGQPGVPVDYIRNLKNWSSEFGECNEVRVCMATLKIVGSPIIKTPGTLLYPPTVDNDGCLKYKCNSSLLAQKFCATTLLDLISNPTFDEEFGGCDPIELAGGILKDNVDLFASQLPNFAHSELDNYIRTGVVKPCDRIIICGCSYDNFSHIPDPYCGQTYYPPRSQFPLTFCVDRLNCFARSLSGGFECAYVCKDPAKDQSVTYNYSDGTSESFFLEGIRKEFIPKNDEVLAFISDLSSKCGVPNKNDPNNINNNVALSEGSFSTSLNTFTQYIKDETAYETLIDLGFQVYTNLDNSFVAPYGISDGNSTSLYHINMYSKEPYRENIEDIIGYSENENKETEFSRIIILQSSDSTSITLGIQDSIRHQVEFSALEFMDPFVSHKDTLAILSTLFKGDIMMDTTVLASSTDTSLFIAFIDSKGSIVGSHTVSNIDHTRDIHYTRLPGTYLLFGKSKSTYIDVNGSPIQLGQHPYFVLDYESSPSLVQKINISPDQEIIDFTANKGSDMALVLRGAGFLNTAPLGPGVHIIRQNLITGIPSLQTIEASNLIPTKSAAAYSYNHVDSNASSLILGLTFENQSTINGQTFVSEGGSDILIIQFDAADTIVSIDHYGSEKDENVSRVSGTYFENQDKNYIFFGGEFSTEIYRRQLGDIEFINTKRGIQKAYVTFIVKELGNPALKNNELAIAEDLQIETNHLKELSVFPNPFTSDFRLKYQHDVSASIEIKITDLFGRNIQAIGKFDLINGELDIPIDMSLLSEGFYLVSVENDRGEITSTKVLKISDQINGTQDD